MMSYVCTMFVFFLMCGIALANPPKLQPLSQEMVNFINSVQNSWKAGQNFHPNTSMEYIKKLAGARSSHLLFPKLSHDNLTKQSAFSIPASFDAREQWPNCPTIKEIRDQGSCGSCWAIAAVTAISDRICIHSNGQQIPHLSAEELISCCRLCGSCNGGSHNSAFLYYENVGFVTGGNFNTNEGCKPYSFPECEHHMNGTRPPCEDSLPTPTCKEQCIPGYSKSYEQDKVYGQFPYRIDCDIAKIQTEIMTNGPVVTKFILYEDFFQYKTGIYHYITGEELGFHTVKILGWGTENGEDYWLVANSWNSDWGENGFLKFRRGTNECDLEGFITAALPEESFCLSKISKTDENRRYFALNSINVCCCSTLSDRGFRMNPVAILITSADECKS
ncbi:hypothetical protein CHUAL_001359 [Chamberlinius hualienensis]